MEILVEVLTANPENVYEALAKLTRWQNLTTKDDLKKSEEEMATNEELKAVETSLREEIGKVEESLREDMRRLWLALNALGGMWGCS
jgi:hypothetical protein